MTSLAVSSFRWLDSLEKEFDKAFVDLDMLIMGLLTDMDDDEYIDDNIGEFVENSKEKLKIMSQAWSQLVQKSQTIFQVNCKLEAQLLNVKSDLVEAKAFKEASVKELEKLMLELHTSQIQLQKCKQQSTTNTSPSSTDPTVDIIQKKLEEEMKKRFGSDNEHLNLAILQEELNEYKKENEYLREQLLDLNSEIFSARLTAKYLDKELAGRIQQIQLFGKNLKAEEHERVWNQLEAEINLNRHKTVMKACRNKLAINNLNNNFRKTIYKQKQRDLNYLKANNLIGQIRHVHLKHKDNKEGLGISITGGHEHGVPILVSEIHEAGPGYRSGQLFVGDAILEVNGISLKDVLHSEAVKILSTLVSFKK